MKNLLLVALLCFAGQLFGQTYTYTTFDAPGAGLLPNLGTVPALINGSGIVAGRYLDPYGVSHGFERIPASGRNPVRFVTFDPPGAGTNPGTGTYALGINALGFVTGAYFDQNTIYHGYIWTGQLGGAFTTFSVPGSTPLTYFGTSDQSINLFGYSTGWYSLKVGNDVTLHGFLRGPFGAFTKFDVPNAPQTTPLSVNVNGTVTGYYTTADFHSHGFTRTLAGVFTTFDSPGCVDTYPQQIGNDGTIAGQCATSFTTAQGFVRAPDGTFATFIMPGATTTSPLALGPDGSVVGISYNPNLNDGIPVQPLQGFVRSPSGVLTVIQVPNTAATFAASINGSGVITGSYLDGPGASHGFIARPNP